MSGTQLMTGGVGLGWYGVMNGGMALGELPVYPAVAKLQRVLNGTITGTAGSMMPFSPSGGRVSEDGRYGSDTHNTTKQYTDWLVRSGQCSRTSSAEVERNGPNALRDCLFDQTGVLAFTSGEVSELQAAWSDWRASLRPGNGGGGGGAGESELQRRMRECAAAGGTWNDATQTCIPAVAEEKGLSTGVWILLALLGAAVAYGIYYAATE